MLRKRWIFKFITNKLIIFLIIALFLFLTHFSFLSLRLRRLIKFQIHSYPWYITNDFLVMLNMILLFEHTVIIFFLYNKMKLITYFLILKLYVTLRRQVLKVHCSSFIILSILICYVILFHELLMFLMKRKEGVYRNFWILNYKLLLTNSCLLRATYFIIIINLINKYAYNQSHQRTNIQLFQHMGYYRLLYWLIFEYFIDVLRLNYVR